MNVVGRAAVACLAIASVAGCARAQARTPQVVAGLEMPPPPARVPIPVILTDTEATPEEAVAAAPTPPPPRPRENAGVRDRAPAAPPAAPPSANAEAAPSGPVLQTTTDVGAVEQKTLGLLASAQRDLDRVGYTALGADARAQYDRAQGFIRQARSALSRKNYDYAQQLADKAAAVASLLVKG